jgi:hypothetical protein
MSSIAQTGIELKVERDPVAGANFGRKSVWFMAATLRPSGEHAQCRPATARRAASGIVSSAASGTIHGP